MTVSTQGNKSKAINSLTLVIDPTMTANYRYEQEICAKLFNLSSISLRIHSESSLVSQISFVAVYSAVKWIKLLVFLTDTICWWKFTVIFHIGFQNKDSYTVGNAFHSLIHSARPLPAYIWAETLTARQFTDSLRLLLCRQCKALKHWWTWIEKLYVVSLTDASSEASCSFWN